MPIASSRLLGSVVAIGSSVAARANFFFSDRYLVPLIVTERPELASPTWLEVSEIDSRSGLNRLIWRIVFHFSCAPHSRTSSEALSAALPRISREIERRSLDVLGERHPGRQLSLQVKVGPMDVVP